MQYKSLHFDNEVINALYSPKDKQYWKFYMESFENQITDLLQFIEKRPDIHNDYILETKNHLLKRMMADLQSLVSDLLSADYDSPIAQNVKLRFEGIELYHIAYSKTN